MFEVGRERFRRAIFRCPRLDDFPTLRTRRLRDQLGDIVHRDARPPCDDEQPRKGLDGNRTLLDQAAAVVRVRMAGDPTA